MEPATVTLTTNDLREVVILLTRWLKTRNEPGRWSPEFESRTEMFRNRMESLISMREEEVGFVNEKREEGKVRGPGK